MNETGQAFSGRIDRPFFTVMALVLAATVVAGFGPGYWRSIGSAEGLPIWVHLHGMAMGLWVALFVTQVVLIRRGAYRLHRTLGLASIGLVAIIVPLGSLTNVLAIRRGATPPFFTNAELFAVDQLDLVLFAGLYGWALIMRKAPAWHKRLLLSGLVLLSYPAIARIGVIRSFGIEAIVPISITLVLVLAMAGPVHDLIRYRRVHPAFVWGTGIVFLAQPAHSLLAASAPVRALVAEIAPAGEP